MSKSKTSKHDDHALAMRLQTFRSLFVAREDAYVIWRGHQPIAVREPLSDEILAAHLRGEYRIGTYLIRPDGTTTFLVFDVDFQKKSRVRKILKRLRKRSVVAHVERSKSKGYHIWVFFDEPIRASEARIFAKLVLRGIEDPKIEIFPRQDGVKHGGLGNCIFLPLYGLDIARERTVFLDGDFAPLGQQWSFLESIRRTPRKSIIEACRQVEPEAKKLSQPLNPTGGPITEGERNTRLTSLGGAMRHYGATEETIRMSLLKENRERCEPPLPDKEVEQIASSVGKYPPAEERKDRKRSAEVLHELLGEGVTFFHTPDSEAYVKVRRENHTETWNTRGASLKQFIAARYYKKYEEPPRAQFLNDLIATLEGIALYDSPEQNVFTRVAELDGTIYLDLCNQTWQAIEINENGWQVLSEPRVNFRRARGMKALPVPRRGASITDLRPFLNLAGNDDFVILTSWLVAALRPRGPYPVLVLQGEAGSAKSTTVRVLRELVDPNTTPLRSEPRETRDLMIAARNSWCIAFDNVSHLSGRLSDDLCRLATGGGFSTRQLYTDADEMLFDATRPLILNGIDAVVWRGDLLDRSLITYLPVIPDYLRKPERKFWRRFKKAQPKLLSALLDAVSCALRRLDSVKEPSLPRMADFAQWVVAAEPALGWAEGTFLRAYNSNRGTANALSLEGSPLVTPLKRLLASRASWRGTAAELLRKMAKHVENQAIEQRNWPKNPQLLSTQLRRIAPQLRASGLDIEFGEKTAGMGSKRIITIKRPATGPSVKDYPTHDQFEKEPVVIQRFPRLLGHGYPIRFPRLKSGASDARDASSEDSRD